MSPGYGNGPAAGHPVVSTCAVPLLKILAAQWQIKLPETLENDAKLRKGPEFICQRDARFTLWLKVLRQFATRTHNPKVAGSNPAPATNFK